MLTSLLPSESEPTGRPTDASGRATEFPYLFLVGWALGWALVGSTVGAGITFTLESLDLPPVLLMSILFAEVVGFSALISARVIFPFFSKLPFAVRLILQVLTLFGGTLFGSVVILWFQPLFTLHRFRTVIMIVLVNAALAVVVGIALHTYDSMRRQIEASYLALRQKEALERELEIAREVQRELLPRTTPDFLGLQLAGVCIPAIGVGGDYYDYLPFSAGRLGLVIADVSGKGIPAALLMAGLQASVRSVALPGVPPCEVNRKLNGLLHQSTSDSRYATFFFATYDAGSRQLTYSNAGHYPPLLVRGDSATRLSDGGPPIGILGKSKYGEGTKSMGAGDLLALYTDGIVEAPNHHDEEFGEDRLVRILMQHRNETLDDVVRAVMDELGQWSEGMPRHDDVTLVLARAV